MRRVVGSAEGDRGGTSGGARGAGEAGTPRERRASPGYELGLVGGFRLSRGTATIALPPHAQRLVAFLSLNDRPVPRGFVAGTLWPDDTERNAAANLRTVLWKLRRAAPSIVDPGRDDLHLSAVVEVDLRRRRDLYAGLLARRISFEEVAAVEPFPSAELLPGWYQDWVLVERERFRQLYLHAMEALAGALTGEHRFGEAVDVALGAVAADPLCETAHRALMQVYVAEGNRGAVLRHYRLLRQFVHDELGVELSPETRSLVQDLAV